MKMEFSSPPGSCCTDLSSGTPPTELNLHEIEVVDSGVNEPREELECPKPKIKIKSSAAFGLCCTDLSSDAPEVREQHQGLQRLNLKMKPVASPCFIAVCIALFVTVVTLIILTAPLAQRKLASGDATTRLEPCPLDWLYNGRKCYYFSKESKDWDQSWDFCSSCNASLALITSQEELNFLMKLTCEHHTWIGLRRRGDIFEWANGTACNDTLCALTDFGECVYIEDGAVRVSGCSLTRPYICTRDPHLSTDAL
ncbi:hypothetical protein NDU88_005077 [Pleurodeles waltl]|uniref:C-type lectin domain-containing protein n=1 Tax=Pleurodeles waltl TaxID=8319 RepID=A0AAV7V5F0_PLEWA|nr:hypothetical protein NDU88_005077 [Pleurodeles waltl]